MRLALLAALLASTRPIEFNDIPASLRPPLASTAQEFLTLRQSIERSTRARVEHGEDEHLAYFILQSLSFTKRQAIEPARSAFEFHSAPTPSSSVLARMSDFLAALDRPARDARIEWWKTNLPASRRRLAGLTQAYTVAMHFLWEKEFAAAGPAIYQNRGYSTDTQVEANYAVATALAVLSALDPQTRLNRILVVGPGLDFAPRTAFRDGIAPQSIQPYAVADALLARKLTTVDDFSMDVVDVNPRVLAFIGNFARSQRPVLSLRRSAGDEGYRDYFDRLGGNIGAVSMAGDLKTIAVKPALLERIQAASLDILTARIDPSPGYDLVVVTNVLLYFNTRELTLALANIHSMLRPGGYLIHNELRPELEALSAGLEMPPIQGRTVAVAGGAKAPLLDAFVIHRKRLVR